MMKIPIVLSVLGFLLAISAECAAGSDAKAPSQGAPAPASPKPRDMKFDAKISRAISMEGLLNGKGDRDDNLRMLKATGAKFIGRSLCLWGGEAGLLGNLERRSSGERSSGDHNT
jgi:hypothetical protein